MRSPSSPHKWREHISIVGTTKSRCAMWRLKGWCFGVADTYIRFPIEKYVTSHIIEKIKLETRKLHITQAQKVTNLGTVLLPSSHCRVILPR